MPRNPPWRAAYLHLEEEEEEEEEGPIPTGGALMTLLSSSVFTPG